MYNKRITVKNKVQKKILVSKALRPAPILAIYSNLKINYL